MYITPNSTLRVLHNIDIDPDYENTLYFANLSDQTSYFVGNTKYTFPAQTYQRVNKNVVRVNRKADDLYDCCYMMFQNTSYGNKWFYAFIDNVEYVNDITSNIYYTIDDIQTWLKDWSFKSCFVERMHTITDEIGDNIVPENIETGEIVMNGDYKPLAQHVESIGGADIGVDIITPWIVLGIVDVQEGAEGNVYDKTYSGAKYFTYSATSNGIQALNQKIDDYNTKPDAIVTMFMCPKFCLGEPTEGGTPSFSSVGANASFKLPAFTYPQTLNGYQPKNRKMYTYPFNYLHIDDAKGNSLNLRYEFFYDLTPKFVVEATLSQPVEISIRPYDYKGIEKYQEGGLSSGIKTLNTECLTLNGYPMCSWNMDAWKAWVAQNSLPLVTKTLTSAIIGGMIGADATMISQGMGTFTDIYQASIKADISRGNFNNGGVNFSHNKQTFFIGRASVNSEMARIIDSYFDRYGYAIKRTLVPTITSRPYWNYIKTVKCFIDGNIPSDAKKHICSIIDKGITFWHDPSTMGMYSLNNAPVQATP